MRKKTSASLFAASRLGPYTATLVAGGLAALVIGATVAVGRALARADDSRVNAVAIEPVVLLEAPLADARATGFVAQGAEVIVDVAGPRGWVYVIAARSEGYALEEDFAMTRRGEGLR